MSTEITDLHIGHAAHEVLEVESSAPLDREFEITLGDSFTDPEVRARFARQQQTGAVRLYRMRNVTLDASLMLLLRDRSRITETRYLVTDQEYADTLVKPLPAVPLDPAVHYVIGCNRAWHNYYHWLVQSLPAIDLSLRHSNPRRVMLIVSPLQPWQNETLRLLGYQEVPRLTLRVSDTLLLPSAEFSDLLGEQMPHTVPRAAMTTFRRMSHPVPWTGGMAEEIYVARTDASNRAMENEAELIAMLQRRGVRIIVPGALTVAEQIAAFRSARLVIGPHGAGMSNIVFCQSGSFVYEMLPRHFANAAYNRLAQAAGLSYWADLFEGGADDRPAHERTWRVDLKTVAARLDAVRARMIAKPRVESAMAFLRRTQMAHPDAGPRTPPPDEPDPPAPEKPRRAGLFARLRRLFARKG